MQRLSEALSAARSELRHRQGCYRWTQDGRCVDCHRYTGIPQDVVKHDAGGESHYYDAHRLPQRSRAQERAAARSSPAEPRTLTPDQQATREAWRRWREQQGDPDPDMPRRARRDS